MSKKTSGLLLLVLLVAVGFGMNGYFYSRLPPEVASEFGFSGEPKRFMAKGTFLIFNLATLTLLPLFMLGLGWISTKLPKWMIDLPNKDYWLAPERIKETASGIFDFILWQAVGVVALLTSVLGCAILANLGHPAAMKIPPAAALLAYLIFVAVSVFRYYRKFKKIPV
jgi:serine/threonine-protein kinase